MLAQPIASRLFRQATLGIGIILALAPSVRAGSQLLRIATFNVENYLAERSGTRPAKSPAEQAKVRESILALKPDVIALEEMGSTNMLLSLQAALRSGGCSLPYWDWIAAHDTNIHVAVLSRYPIAARHSRTNEAFLLDGRRMEVSRGFAELVIQVNPKFQFTLLAAHLKSRLRSAIADEEEWRYEEAVTLRRIIDRELAQDPEENLVVLGDFNDVKDSKPVRTIMGRGSARLFDTCPAERNGDDAASNHGRETRRVCWTHYYGVEDTFSRIDYILISPHLRQYWRQKETYVLALPNWGLASDHRPIEASFEVP